MGDRVSLKVIGASRANDKLERLAVGGCPDLRMLTEAQLVDPAQASTTFARASLRVRP